MVKIFIFLFVYLISLLILDGCSEENYKQNSQLKKAKPALSQGEVIFWDEKNEERSRILVEIAEDEYTRVKGLMFRENLPENQGMLFIFEEEKLQYFWMKNTPTSLDIIYANGKYEIVSISKYTEPYSQQTYPSGKPAIYVVEVVAGYCDRYDIKAGDLIKITKF